MKNKSPKVSYTIPELKSLSSKSIIHNIEEYLKTKLEHKGFSEGQLIAWQKSIKLLKRIFEKENKYWRIIFEFLIPLSSGKRPDILLINGTTIFIVEVKNRENYFASDLDQIRGYKLDLEFYHSTAKYFDIEPILLVLNAKELNKSVDGINILSPEYLKPFLLTKYIEEIFVNPEDLNKGNFKPIPSIIEYAKSVYENKPIENIETPVFADSNLISQQLEEIYQSSREDGKKSIVFLKGTPGSGKSAIGLNCAFSLNGLYVAKNRQFSEYLIKELDSYSNIKTSHNFHHEFTKNGIDPDWSVVVFDEAQRFWNDDKMRSYFGEDKSEAEAILELYCQKEYCLILVLIGDGQEIGWGETSDLYNWKYALRNNKSKWDVYGVRSVIKQLGYNTRINYVEKDNFELVKSYRNLKTPNYAEFVNNLLDHEGGFSTKNFLKLKNDFSGIRNNGFDLLITRNLEDALTYCRSRYGERPNSFCTLTSSESFINDMEELPQSHRKLVYEYEVANRLEIDGYFQNNGLNDSDGVFYPLPEYQSIGFEIQMPIIAWGYDYLWYRDRWNFEFVRRHMGNTISRKNTYRIMLTRGRDGVILYFPAIWELDRTYDFFRQLGGRVI